MPLYVIHYEYTHISTVKAYIENLKHLKYHNIVSWLKNKIL